MTAEPIVRHEPSALDLLSWSRKMIDGDLRSAVGRLPVPLRRIAGYHFGWWDAHGHPVEANAGKAIRPTLVLLAAEAVGGSAGPAVPAAVAVELVHNFSLLHDDVMDADRTRRHRPTAWTVFGVPQAILTGDAMVALASEVLAGSDSRWASTAVRWLSDSVIELCDGQYGDVAFESRTQVELAECLRMVQGKTASLLGASCALGALAGGAGAVKVNLMRAFGRHLGLAFQLVDDVLGIFGDTEVTGKPAGADLMRRKKSLPVTFALTSGTSEGAQLSDLYADDAPVEVDRARDLIARAGGREWAQRMADEEMGRALASLDEADCRPAARARLVNLAGLVVKRNH